MIKFFRKIRQKLLTESKFSKYLLYAIGEILLVVIGIMIALQLNTWNQKRIESHQTVELLKNMIIDLKIDVSNLKNDISNYERYIRYSRTVLNVKDFQLFTTDSIYNLLPTNSSSTKITNQTFEKLKNAGITNTLDSKELFNSITKYYTTESSIIDIIILWDWEYSLKTTDFYRLGDDFEAPILNDTIVTRYLDNIATRKNNLLKLLTTKKSRNYIRYAISRKLVLLYYFKFNLSLAEELIELIEKELENANAK